MFILSPIFFMEELKLIIDVFILSIVFNNGDNSSPSPTSTKTPLIEDKLDSMFAKSDLISFKDSVLNSIDCFVILLLSFACDFVTSSRADFAFLLSLVTFSTCLTAPLVLPPILLISLFILRIC